MSTTPQLAVNQYHGSFFNWGCPGGVTDFSVWYQGELLELGDPQNRDPRRKSPPETKNRLAYYHPFGEWGVLISGQISYLTIYAHVHAHAHVGVVKNRWEMLRKTSRDMLIEE